MIVIAQRTFAGGEIAPAVYGRPDQTKYQTGLRVCRNWVVMKNGGVQTRPGTYYLGESPQRTGNQGKSIKLVPFKYIASGGTIDYFLELGQGIFYVWRDNARVVSSTASISNVSNSNPGQVTAAAHGFSTGDVVTISGVVGMPEINGREYLVGGVTANTFILRDMVDAAINTTGFGAYVSGGTASKAFSLYSDADWAGVNNDATEVMHHAQQGNFLYLTFRTDTQVRVITKGATDTDWTIDLWSAVDGPDISAPTGLTADGWLFSAKDAQRVKYVVTAESSVFEESRQSSTVSVISRPADDTSRISPGSAVPLILPFNNQGAANATASIPVEVNLPGTSSLVYTSTTDSPAVSWTLYFRNYAGSRITVTGTFDTPEIAQTVSNVWYVEAIFQSAGTGGNVSFTIGGVPILPVTASTATGFFPLAGTYTKHGPGLTNGMSRQLRLYSAATDLSARTFTVTGVDEFDTSVVEQITGPRAGLAVVTTTYWRSVQSVVADAAIAAATLAEIGTVGAHIYPVSLDWSNVTGAVQYNIYKSIYGVFGYIGTSTSSDFIDTGFEPDYSQRPPQQGVDLSPTGSRPATVAVVQQRLCFANIWNDPSIIHTSAVGLYTNLDYHIPAEDSDAIKFKIAGRKYGEVRNLVDLSRFVVFASSGVWIINSDGSAITPANINATQHSHHGASWVPPAVIGGNAVYLERGARVFRDLGYQFSSDNYTGNDLTVFSSHLFDLHTFSSMGYQETPHSVIWAVRNDGVFLGLTYLQEHGIWGWHRHDFDNGEAGSVMCADGNIDSAAYFVVRREMSGTTRRYIEKLSDRQFQSVEDYICVDSALTYNGYNGAGKTMTLSGGTTWDYTETLTLTCSAAYFTSTAVDVGNQIHLFSESGEVIRFDINTYISNTVVYGKVTAGTVPVSMRNVAIPSTRWAYAVDEVHGLWHLNGYNVSVFGDGLVVKSPHNPDYNPVATVTNGGITFSGHYAKIQAGLPITCDLQTLDLDSEARQAITGKDRFTGKIALTVDNTRGLWIGDAFPTGTNYKDGLIEAKVRQTEGYDEPTNLTTGVIDHQIESKWDKNSRICIRQVDPVPATILSIGIYTATPGSVG